jgi:hypothetical protein
MGVPVTVPGGYPGKYSHFPLSDWLVTAVAVVNTTSILSRYFLGQGAVVSGTVVVSSGIVVSGTVVASGSHVVVTPGSVVTYVPFGSYVVVSPELVEKKVPSGFQVVFPPPD